MQEGLEARIRELGHWRFNIRPLQPPAEKLTLERCAEVVERSRVSLRGWDYPHISRNDGRGHGGNANVGEYVENWCNWFVHLEFWRMYRSSQFIHYTALTEDVSDDGPRRPAGPALSILGAIYTVTEMIEFMSRLRQSGLYEEGVFLSITLGNTSERQLWISELNRMPFFDEKKTAAASIVIERSLSAEKLQESPPIDQSLGLLMELFDHFGWNPDPSVIRSDQERFYKKQW